MASRYWVGGTAAWDSTAGTKWALTSGGAGGQTVPTSADDVFFDAASGAVTCTLSGTLACKSLNCTGFTGTLNGAANITVSGSVTFSAGMTVSTSANWTINATATITTNGKSMGSNIDFSATAGTITLAGALTCSGLRLLAGTLTTGGNAITATGSFQIASGTTFNMGASTITTPLLSELGATISAGTSTINVGGSFSSTGKTWNAVTFTTAGGSLGGSATISALTFPTPSTGVSPITMGGSYTVTTLVLSGASVTSRYFLCSDTPGTRRTLNATTWTTVSDIDFRDISLTNAKSPTRGGNCGNNLNITFPATKTVYWNLAGAQNWSATGWATSSGGTPSANNFPLPQDTAVFNDTGSVTGTITLNAKWNIGTVNMSARTTAMTLASGASGAIVYGNWLNGTGTTLSGSGALQFNGTTTQTITSNGRSFSMEISGSGSAHTITLADALTTAGNFVLSNTVGLNLANNTLTALTFQNNSTSARTLAFGTGSITVTGTGSVAFTVLSTSLSVTGTPVVNMTYSGAAAMTVSTAGLSETVSISFNFSAGIYTLTFANSGTARNLNFTGFAGTLTSGASLSVFGNLTLSSGMTVGSASSIFMQATSGTKTITSNGTNINTNFFISGAGGTFQLQDSLSVNGTSGDLGLINGTLDLNGQTATVRMVLTQAGTKNLTFNGGTLIVTGSSFNNAAPTGFTTTAGTGVGTIRMTSGTAKTFVGGDSTFNCVLDQGGGGALTISGANTFADITNSYSATGATTITFAGNQTVTNFTATGASGKVLTINSSVAGTARTITKTSGVVSVNYLSLRDSTATGGATFYAGPNSTSVSNNTGWLFAAPPTGNFMAFFM